MRFRNASIVGLKSFQDKGALYVALASSQGSRQKERAESQLTLTFFSLRW